MKKIFLLFLVSLVWATLVFAENITREQADEIVADYVKSEALQLVELYANINEPNEAGVAITTSNGETFRAKYACWVYCLDESEPAQRRYIFIKEEGGSLLEVIASNDVSELGASWIAMNPTGLVNPESGVKLLYQNPVSDWLTVPCDGENVRVEIYDLNGTRLFSELLFGKDSCQLNVSFLSAGIYVVRVDGKTYKIVKN